MNALAFALIAFFAWGISNFLAKKSINKSGFQISLPIIHATVFLISLIFFGYQLSIDIDQILPVLFLAIIEFMGYLCLYKAYEVGNISVVAPISAAYGVVSLIIAIIFLKEVMNPFVILLIILIIIGIGLISLELNSLKSQTASKGVIFALGVMLFFGLYFPLWNILIKPEDWTTSFVLDKFILFLISFIYSFRFYKSEFKLKLQNSLKSFLPVGLLEFIGFASVNGGISLTQNSTALITALSSSYPLITIILAVIFLKEGIHKTKIMGALFIISGIFLIGFINS